MITVACDGAALANPTGPGGWGWYVSESCWQAGAAPQASNNAMELTALLRFCEATAHLDPDTPIAVVLDSTYVRDAVTKWVIAWERNGWMTSARKPVKNVELIRPIVDALRARPGIELRWTRGHSGHPLNEAADRICTSAARAVQEGTPVKTGPGWVDGESSDRPEVALAAGVVSEAVPATVARRTPNPTETAGTALLLLRHGETPHSVERRFSGSSDMALTDNGLAQARAAAARLSGSEDIAAIICSPLQRTRQTAAEVAERLGLPVTIEPDLREIDFGDWEGMTYREVAAQDPELLAAWADSPKTAPPGGESLADCLVRVSAAAERLVQDHPGQRVLVVTHVTPIKLLIGSALESVRPVLRRVSLDLCSLSRVDYRDGGATVRLVNDISHLGSPWPRGRPRPRRRGSPRPT